MNKLCFHFVWILLILFAAGPALAQYTSKVAVEGTIVGDNLNHNRDRIGGVGAPSNNIRNLGKKGFVVYEAPNNPNKRNGIIDDSVVQVEASGDPGGVFVPDIHELLSNGGTIELAVKKGPAPASNSSYVYAKVAMHSLAITEIMWGNDTSARGTHQGITNRSLQQWVEVYNSNADLKYLDRIRLVFSPNKRVIRDEIIFRVATGASDVSNGVYTPHANNVAVTYTVVDRVCLINRFGVKWDLKGSSGRTLASTDGKHPVQTLVSMYRKRSTNDQRTAYKYKANGDPDGDVFKDGTEGGQWIASTGRVNVEGPIIGTPGAVQQVHGGKVTSAKNPGSLPVGNIIINEIFNSEKLQWVELHNTGTSEVNVKNYEIDAVTGLDKVERVFTVPNRDTKIPGGGFLLITNRDPANSVLAGGVDLYDSNKFNKGADHLYIVVPKDNNNKWMPEKGFLMLLRNGNDKNNHEKVVDMAGNIFFKTVRDNLTTDVWPLIGWTVPGDRDNNDWGGSAANSLIRNTGRTYARIDQKSGGNRLHKDHWHLAGPVGGLGYDPKVDMEIAPGTPGYPNNGQVNNLAGLTSDSTSKVVISEIMYDPGDNNKLVQWIELYNSSMVHSVSLQNWKLEVRNIDTDVESYVDSSFKFDGDAIILPNQTLLLVSDRSSASDVPSNRVYNLYQKHRNDLGLSNRRSVLLSSEGFYLRLTDKDNKEADVVSNIKLNGPRRTVVWDLPEMAANGLRHSILRQFGSRKRDGSADAANDGTMESSWRVSESVGSYYGHRDDTGSPGHREGSPLPVSLSSFRPVRDAGSGAVVIRWTTESELNNAGFNILRSDAKEGAFTVVNVKGLIAGHGTTSEKHTYTWTDTTAKPNVVYYYQIEDVSLDGQRTTLRTTHLRGTVTASGKLTTVWGHLKFQK